MAARGLQHIYAISAWFWGWEIELQALRLSSAPRLKSARAMTEDFTFQKCTAPATQPQLQFIRVFLDLK